MKIIKKGGEFPLRPFFRPIPNPYDRPRPEAVRFADFLAGLAQPVSFCCKILVAFNDKAYYRVVNFYREKIMSIDFKPAVRFLKKIVDKGAEIGKNIATFVKNDPMVATFLTAEVGMLIYIAPPAVGAVAAFGITLLADRVGKFKRIINEEERARMKRAKSFLSGL